MSNALLISFSIGTAVALLLFFAMWVVLLLDFRVRVMEARRGRWTRPTRWSVVHRNLSAAGPTAARRVSVTLVPSLARAFVRLCVRTVSGEPWHWEFDEDRAASALAAGTFKTPNVTA